jgi:serine/threonine protein kinase
MEILNIQTVTETLKQQKVNHSENVLREVAEYKLIESIGQGAYGTIYYSQCLSSGDYFAIKEVNYSSARELQSTMDEVEILSLVNFSVFNLGSWTTPTSSSTMRLLQNPKKYLS